MNQRMPYIPEFDVFLKNYVATLPQARHIKEEDAKIWYETAKKLEPERLMWHYDRLHGLGGSDMGEVVAAYRGEYNMFKTPYDIIEEKLMRRTIEGGTRHTRWGTKMEPVTRELFQEDFACSTVDDLAHAVTNFKDDRFPWMRCNVDDIVSNGPLPADPRQQNVWVVDYKNKAIIPPEPTLVERVQVHLYRKALVESGYQGNVGLLLVYTDATNKEVVPKAVDYDPDLEMEILDAGNDVWQHVLNDTKPKFDRKNSPLLILSEEAKATMGPLEKQLARAKVIAEAGKREVDLLQAKVDEIIKEEAVGQGLLKSLNIPLDMLSSIVRERLDVPRLETMLAAQKTPATDLQKDGKNLDEAKVIAFIKEHGGDPFEFKEKVYDIKLVKEFCSNKELETPIDSSISFSLKASKAKQITKEDIELTKETGYKLVASIIPDVLLPKEDKDLDQTIGPRA